ncbi:MAG: four helix bundle protein [Deltaproteobacteria bacterium]|nr:four helix bundle protein [Deltaproteobacteria bacterium]
MGRIDRFEDLITWQKARELTKAIYQITQQGKFAKVFGLSDQIQRVAVSVMSNTAEGFERNRRKDTFEKLLQQTEEVARIISGLRVSVEKQRNGGK